MAAKRTPKMLNPNSTSFKKIEDIKNTKITPSNVVDVLLSIESKDICSSVIMKLFGRFNGKSACNPYDMIKIPKGLYGKIHNKPNKNEFVTTAGLWVFNKYFIEEELFDLFGYVNKEISKKMFGKLNNGISDAVMMDDIPTTALMTFGKKCQEFMKYETILSPNYTEDLLCCTKKIDKLKQKLLKENKEAIENADPVVVEKIEQELIAYGKELLKDDPAMDMYLSGAQGNFNNHFKNLFAIKGCIQNPDPYAKKKYNVITSCYMDGVKPEEYANLANSLANGPYSRSNKTAIGGYWENLFISAFQHLILGPAESDCGTTRTITVSLTDDNFDVWKYNYIKEGDKLTELTYHNKDKYIGKKVKFRYSSLCESKNGICSKCAGNMFYRLGIKNVGVMTAQLPAKLKLTFMKAFHDSTIVTTEMDAMKAFGLK